MWNLLLARHCFLHLVCILLLTIYAEYFHHLLIFVTKYQDLLKPHIFKDHLTKQVEIWMWQHQKNTSGNCHEMSFSLEIVFLVNVQRLGRGSMQWLSAPRGGGGVGQSDLGEGDFGLFLRVYYMSWFVLPTYPHIYLFPLISLSFYPCIAGICRSINS